MPEDEATVDESAGQTGETLSCVACRNRKLKCDRVKPICARCAKVNGDCVYPESRRKPAFKRRNVRELEARLAQVEVLLKEAGDSRPTGDKQATVEDVDEPIHFDSIEVPMTEEVFLQGMDFTEADVSFDPNITYPYNQEDSTPFLSGPSVEQEASNSAFNGELMDLGGIFETLPPFEIMEELNRIYFERQQHFMPAVHPARYMQAFYSPPHMKPPMCLQYAIWALACHGHQKYHGYHDVFYRRARQYAESDEMKGYGEHFITVRHAQAWCIIAVNEAKGMMFTRAAMSCARAVRLVEMMGLHRLDGPPDEMSPTLLPPKDWAELEERRRTFWGIFCIDSHCSISTGWPHLIDHKEVTTHLPANESAFHKGEERESYSLHEALKGRPYSSFAGNVVICHLFNQILKHVHRPQPNDEPDNYEYGEFWQRHRDIDNTISSVFMFLPEPFRLPENYRDPTAVHTNLNLHASIICLHHAAIEKIDIHKLPDSAKKASQNRLTTAAQEIVNIIKLTSHVATNPKSPLAALSLYCAASVYVYLSKEAQAPTNIDNLDFIISAMEAIGRDHLITRVFLRQVILDIEQNGLQSIVKIPRIDSLGEGFCGQLSQNIPLLARSKISRHSKVQPPLPGRLPLGKPVGRMIPANYTNLHSGWPRQIYEDSPRESNGNSSDANANKRKRTAPSTLDGGSESSEQFCNATGIADTLSGSTPSSHSSPQDHASAGAPPQPFVTGFSVPGILTQQHVNLPHRTGSPAPANNAANNTIYRNTNAKSSNLPRGNISNNSDRPGVTINPSLLGNMGPSTFTTAGHGQSQTETAVKDAMGSWDPASMGVYAQFTDNGTATGGHGAGAPFEFATSDGVDVNWEALGTNMGVGTTGDGPTGPRREY
ncbi:Uu.00g003160.m01.CDS01 [Anthostomella pinea]|uniref:Uu.00g003160.m01.CDS01 n=1 Tax=Anthostomella pinea TaxID=933095 RepID=A0AAI8VJP4_9PEZI|nr:Uu.00g003160.m01.CDS01 [Anthostomella pinea]